MLEGFEKSRLKALPDHFADIEDPRERWRVAHPLPEVLFLVVCGMIRDCEDYDLIADWPCTALAARCALSLAVEMKFSGVSE